MPVWTFDGERKAQAFFLPQRCCLFAYFLNQAQHLARRLSEIEHRRRRLCRDRTSRRVRAQQIRSLQRGGQCLGMGGGLAHSATLADADKEPGD